MSAIITEKVNKRLFKNSFFFWMTIVMAFFVFTGFGLTYWKPMASGTLAPLPPIVHLHGLLYSTWMLLLVVQAFLINVKSVRLHKSLGTFGISIATGVIITGAFITILFGNYHRADPMPDYYNFMYLGVVAVINFSALFWLAIRNVRNPDNHRRLILFASMSLLAPGINRFYMVPWAMTNLPLLAMYLTLDAMIVAILIHDWRTMGKLCTATLAGAAFIIIPELLHAPVAGSEAFARLCTILTDLAHYR